MQKFGREQLLEQEEAHHETRSACDISFCIRRHRGKFWAFGGIVAQRHPLARPVAAAVLVVGGDPPDASLPRAAAGRDTDQRRPATIRR